LLKRRDANYLTKDDIYNIFGVKVDN